MVPLTIPKPDLEPINLIPLDHLVQIAEDEAKPPKKNTRTVIPKKKRKRLARGRANTASTVLISEVEEIEEGNEARVSLQGTWMKPDKRLRMSKIVEEHGTRKASKIQSD